jgi:hypothetical protein
METHDVQALVAFGKLGMDLAASKILSLCALVGVVALAAFVAYSPSLYGAVCTAIVAICFIAAVRAEKRVPKEE